MISIIIPTYNVERYLEECLSSIMLQDFEDFEVICVDDGSGDGTVDIARRYACLDRRFSVLEQDHANAGAARNKGLACARGEYLLFFDADDFMLPATLSSFMERARQTDADIVCCRSQDFADDTGELIGTSRSFPRLDERRVYSGEQLSGTLFQSFLGWPWDKLFRRAFVHEHRMQFQELSSTNDARFVFCSLCLARRVAFVPEVLVAHRSRTGSIEKSRHKSPQNACIAARDIERILHEKGLWERFGKSYRQWTIDFLYWNWVTLRGDARAVIEDELRRIVTDDAFDADVFDQTVAMRFARAARELHTEPGANGFTAAADLMEQHDRFMRELQEKNAEIDRLRGELEEARESTSFKVGWAITALPRTVKDALTARGAARSGEPTSATPSA